MEGEALKCNAHVGVFSTRRGGSSWDRARLQRHYPSLQSCKRVTATHSILQTNVSLSEGCRSLGGRKSQCMMVLHLKGLGGGDEKNLPLSSQAGFLTDQEWSRTNVSMKRSFRRDRREAPDSGSRSVRTLLKTQISRRQNVKHYS